MKGGSALFTARSVAQREVAQQISQEWGEAIWTAKDLCHAAFMRKLDEVATRRLILG